ncbi:MAG: DNA repair protein RecO [Clostridia bacterium]|nr:DNA repair protein RecO [Clostridia bacterium]
MEQMKNQGLILKTVNLNDNDRIFTVLTRDSGKITVMAKGIRSQKHKCFSAMQQFCYSDFVLERRTGMYFPVEARVIENFYNLRNSVEKLALAAYITDIVSAIPEEFPVEDEYFSFILNTLFLTAKADAEKQGIPELLRLKAIFELKTVCENGYMPEVTKCECCGSAKNIEYFDITNGRVICKDCKDKPVNADVIKITPEVHKSLYSICESDMRAALSVRPTEQTVRLLSEAGEEYLKNQMDIYLTSLDYFKNLIVKDV